MAEIEQSNETVLKWRVFRRILGTVILVGAGALILVGAGREYKVCLFQSEEALLSAEVAV